MHRARGSASGGTGEELFLLKLSLVRISNGVLGMVDGDLFIAWVVDSNSTTLLV